MWLCGPSRHFAGLRNLVAIGAIADSGEPNPEDLWVHGLSPRHTDWLGFSMPREGQLDHPLFDAREYYAAGLSDLRR
jgi:hypothetical protein